MVTYCLHKYPMLSDAQGMYIHTFFDKRYEQRSWSCYSNIILFSVFYHYSVENDMLSRYRSLLFTISKIFSKINHFKLNVSKILDQNDYQKQKILLNQNTMVSIEIST